MARTTSHPKEETFNFRVPANLKEAFQKATEKEDRPAAQVIRDFMRAYVDEHQEPQAGHDAWFRQQVQAAIDSPSKTTPHDNVIKEIRKLIEKLTKDDNENNMA